MNVLDDSFLPHNSTNADMSFEFVIETPTQRRINRNNHKLIQQRATQVGARTRSEQARRKKQAANKPQVPANHDVALDNAIPFLSRTSLALADNCTFRERFGPNCYRVYLPETDVEENSSRGLICDPTTSVLQRRLLDALAATTQHKDANQMFKIGTLTSNDFLSFVPSLYSQSKLLDATIECLFARMNLAVPLFQPSSTTCMPSTIDTPYRLYGKALQCLRNELDDPQQQSLVYLWYATKLLTLYELITMGDETGWVWHAAGAARILYRIGPDNLCSEFELSLLASQLQIQVAETIFTDKPCYLADPRWQCALNRTVLPFESYGPRSRCSISLWSIGARLPNVFHILAMNLHLPHRSNIQMSSSKLIRRIGNDLEQWRTLWYSDLDTVCRNAQSSGGKRHQVLNILLAFHMIAIITRRLLISHRPYQMHNIEAQVSDHCSTIFAFKELMSAKLQQEQGRSIYFKVASGTHTTVSNWKAAISCSTFDGLIDPQTFDEWCASIGRSSNLDLAPND